MVYFFTVLFGLLVYWLLSFVMRDIGTRPGPAYEKVEERLLDQQLLKDLRSAQNEIAEATRSIASRKERQAVLRDSTSNSEKTMNQLLQFQRLSREKGVTPSPEEVQALAESQRLFLANQAKYQEMNDQVAGLTDQLTLLQDRQRALQARLDSQREPVQKEFNRQQSRHQLALAALKLSVLLPLLAAAVWLFLKKRGALYAPLVHGFGLAVLVKVGFVMHEHFPTLYFKYILLGAALLLVAGILLYLLRVMAFPKPDWLLKQYRDAYEHFFCPACDYPIRRGPLKYFSWTRSSLKKLQAPALSAVPPDEPYVCPACGTCLFEECPSCKSIRHSLLPACAHCGAEKPLSAGPQLRGIG